MSIIATCMRGDGSFNLIDKLMTKVVSQEAYSTTNRRSPRCSKLVKDETMHARTVPCFARTATTDCQHDMGWNAKLVESRWPFELTNSCNKIQENCYGGIRNWMPNDSCIQKIWSVHLQKKKIIKLIGATKQREVFVFPIWVARLTPTPIMLRIFIYISRMTRDRIWAGTGKDKHRYLSCMLALVPWWRKKARVYVCRPSCVLHACTCAVANLGRKWRVG